MQVIEAPGERRRSDRRRPKPSAMAMDLCRALEREEIGILFQPQFACSDNRLVGAEALARWNHPVRGRIGGEALFEIAREAQLVERLSHHVARAALSTAGNWPVPLRLSLNVTAPDVEAGDFAQVLGSALVDAGFPPEHLTLEITEQVLLSELSRTAERLHQLAALGVSIALDDFGAGFCNFDYLKRLPIDYLKLDRSMVEGIAENDRDLAVVRGILAMARALGLKVVAEGIEHAAQRQAVAREGCAMWQGYLGAEPMPAEQFVRLIGV